MATKLWISTSSGDWATSGNWSPSGVPAGGDDVYLDGTGTADISTGLNQSTITLASMTISANYTGKIGTAAAYLQISATALNIGTPSQSSTAGQGSTRIKIDLGSVASTVTVYSTARTTTDTGLEPVRIIGTNSSNVISVLSGRVGVATTSPSETSTLATANVTGNDSTLNLGAGCTLTTVTNNGGTLNVNSAITTLNCISGTTTTKGTGAITTINAYGGTANLWHRASGTDITTLNWSGATLDFKGVPTSLSITNTAVVRGGSARVFSASQVNWGTITLAPNNVSTMTVTLE